MKESPNSNYPKLIFRETFRDEASVRKNGGLPSNVTFSNGVGGFNGFSSKINYNLGLNGTYSVRIRCKPTVFNNQFLFDVRGTNIDGTGYVQLNVTTGIITKSSGTSYVNGVVLSQSLLNINNEIIITGMSLTQGSGDNKTLIGSHYANNLEFNGEIDLVEIYKGTLTPSEVKNLYENKWNKEVSHNNLLLDFDSTQGAIKDRTGKNTLTPTDVSIKKVGQNYSANFNGSTSKIDTGSDFIGTKAVTVCWWFKYNKGKTQPRIVDNSRFSASVVLIGNILNVTSDNYTNNPVSTAGAILINTWQFIAITRSMTGIVNIYIGGLNYAPVLSGAANQNSGTPTAGTTNVIIGNDSVQTRTFDGNIALLKVYEGILDIDTIAQIWSETRKEIG